MEANKDLLNEEHYQKVVKKLRIIVKVLLVLGLATLAFGIWKYSSCTASLAPDESTFSCDVGPIVLGAVMLAVDLMLTLFTYQREIEAFTMQQSLPLHKEAISDVAPTAAEAAEKLAHGVTKGVLKAQEKTQPTEKTETKAEKTKAE